MNWNIIIFDNLEPIQSNVFMKGRTIIYWISYIKDTYLGWNKFSIFILSLLANISTCNYESLSMCPIFSICQNSCPCSKCHKTTKNIFPILIYNTYPSHIYLYFHFTHCLPLLPFYIPIFYMIASISWRAHSCKVSPISTLYQSDLSH